MNVLDEHSGVSKEEKVMGDGIGELEMEELVPEWRKFVHLNKYSTDPECLHDWPHRWN